MDDFIEKLAEELDSKLRFGDKVLGGLLDELEERLPFYEFKYDFYSRIFVNCMSPRGVTPKVIISVEERNGEDFIFAYCLPALLDHLNGVGGSAIYKAPLVGPEFTVEKLIEAIQGFDKKCQDEYYGR